MVPIFGKPADTQEKSNPNVNGQKPLKILIVAGSLAYGGAERQIFELTRRLEKGRFVVSVFLLSDLRSGLSEALEREGFDVVFSASKSIFRRFLKLRNYIVRKKVDIVYAFLCIPSIFGFFATRFTKVRVFVPSIRFTNPRIFFLHKWLTVFACHFASAVVGNAEKVGWFVEKIFLVAPRKIRIIHNGTDTEYFTPAENSVNTPVIGTVGKWTVPKNPWLFLQIAESLHKKYPNLDFMMVGYTHKPHHEIQQFVSDSVYKRIRFTGITADVLAFYCRMQVFVLTSDSEGMPNALCEAMSCGIAPVVSKVGGCEEIVENNISGFLVDKADRDAYVQRIVELLNDAELRKKMGFAARKRIVEKFSVGQMVRKTAELFEGLAG